MKRKLSVIEYAGYRKREGFSGGSVSAVRKALERGRISSDADGLLNPAKCDRQWRENSLLRFPTDYESALVYARTMGYGRREAREWARFEFGAPRPKLVRRKWRDDGGSAPGVSNLADAPTSTQSSGVGKLVLPKNIRNETPLLQVAAS